MIADNPAPQNIAAEESVLGSILIDGSVLPDVILVLNSEDFFRDSHQVIYVSMTALFAQGFPVNVITVADDLQRRGKLTTIGGTETLVHLVESVPHSADAVYHAGIVRSKAVTRNTVVLASQMLRDSYSNDFTAEQLIGRAMTGLLAIQDTGMRRKAMPIAEMVNIVLEDIGQRQNGNVGGMATGFAVLDETLGGLQPEQLMIIAGRPSMGKSALAVNICEHVAVNLGVPVLFVTLEMSGQSLVERMLVSRGRIDNKSARTGRLNDHDLERLYKAAQELEQCQVFFDDTPATTVIQVIAAARGLALRHKIGLVIVDYIQLLESDEYRESRQEQIAKVSRRLKGLARELQIPVIALSQLNRQSEGREDKRPRMADLRESGALEQDADIVLLIHRPDYYKPDDKPGITELIISKHRQGATGTVELVFFKEQMRFGKPTLGTAANRDVAF